MCGIYYQSTIAHWRCMWIEIAKLECMRKLEGEGNVPQFPMAGGNVPLERNSTRTEAGFDLMRRVTVKVSFWLDLFLLGLKLAGDANAVVNRLSFGSCGIETASLFPSPQRYTASWTIARKRATADARHCKQLSGLSYSRAHNIRPWHLLNYKLVIQARHSACSSCMQQLTMENVAIYCVSVW